MRTAMMLLVTLTLIACNDSTPKTEPTTAKDHVWSGQVKALDKARAVGKTVDAQGQAQAAATEEQSR